MKNEMGVWLDHRQAIIVSNHDEVEEVKRITSDMEKHVRYSGVSDAAGAGEPHTDTTEDGRDRRFDTQLNRYYDEVISYLRDASSILILGPGEAKVEFHQRLKGQNLSDCIIAIKTADKMTDSQLVARVRQHFQEAHNNSN